MATGIGVRRGGGKRGRRSRRLMGEINVTPFVDVMLVLLIIFMVAAPLLTVGVPVDLPKTEAKSLPSEQEPLTVTILANGQVYLQNGDASHGAGEFCWLSQSGIGDRYGRAIG